jgi:hypothetical protein
MEQSGPAGSYGPPIDTTGRRRRRRIATIVAVIALLLIILILLLLFPRPTATANLTVASKNLTTSLTLPGRPLSSSQQDSRQGTPTGPQSPGTTATGTLTFKNSTFSTVTIPAGTHITTNSTGQEVITDETVDVPPDPVMIPGVKDGVRAHAAKIGKEGNIEAMAIDKPCCTADHSIDGITVFNPSAFTGGTDAQTTPTVQQSDIEAIATSLKTSLTQKAQSDIQSQTKPDEKLASPTVVCPDDLTKVTSKPGLGESAANFTVTVSITCSDVAYNQQQATDQLKQKLTKQLDSGFELVNTKIDQVTVEPNGNGNVHVSGTGTEQYRFTDAQKSNLASNIARKTKSDAIAWLKKQPGVTNASISVTGPVINLSGTNNLPDDVGAITIKS